MRGDLARELGQQQSPKGLIYFNGRATMIPVSLRKVRK
jgi:hypothetical protein